CAFAVLAECCVCVLARAAASATRVFRLTPGVRLGRLHSGCTFRSGDPIPRITRSLSRATDRHERFIPERNAPILVRVGEPPGFLPPRVDSRNRPEACHPQCCAAQNAENRCHAERLAHRPLTESLRKSSKRRWKGSCPR